MRAIVLGAGKGKRLLTEKSDLPKVLRKANGKSLIEYSLDSIDFIPESDTYIVVGYKKEQVIESIKGDYTFVSQDEQLGTGHAVAMAEPFFTDYDGHVLVLYGDMPLFKKETYENIIKEHRKNNSDCTILTSIDDNPPAYGRIIRDSNNKIINIIEQKDCNDEQLKIKELNVGIYVFDSKLLFQALKFLKNDNNQGEYYLTDIPKILIEQGKNVNAYTIYNTDEIYGVNTPEDLKYCEEVLQKREGKKI